MLRTSLFRPAVVIAFAAFAARPVAAQDETPPAKLLPPAVYAYVAAPDAAALKERFNDSAFGAMLRDPKLQPTIDQIKEKVNGASGKVQEQLGVSLGEVLGVPSGEVAFAVCDVPGQSVGMILILDYGGNAAVVDKLIQKAEGELEKKGARRATENFEGTEIVVYTRAASQEAEAGDDLDIEGDDETAGAGSATNVAWFRKDDRLVLGNGADVLEAVLARWAGDHDDTFADSEVYAYIADKLRTDDRDPAIVWYVDPIGGLQTALTRAEGAPPQLQMVSAFLPTLGLTSLKAIGGSLDMATSEFDSITKVFFYVERPASGNAGVLGVLEFPPAELGPPEWVTDAATGYFGANWNVGGAVTSVSGLVDLVQGPGAFDRLMQQAASNPSGPKLNPRSDFLDQLGGAMHMVNYPIVIPRTQQAAGQLPAQQPAIIALDVKDEQKMKDVLAKLAQTQNFPGETRQFQGSTVYELPMKNPQGGEPGKMAMTVANGHLFFATEPSRLEEVLRGAGGTALAETEAYKEIAAHIPDQVSIIGFQDQRDQLKSIYEAFRTSENAPQLLAQLGVNPKDLPPFEDIAKYLRTSGSYAVPDENGALLVSFGLKLDE